MQHQNEEYHRPLLKEIVLLGFLFLNVISATVTGNVRVPGCPIEAYLDVLEQTRTLEEHYKLKI